MKTFYTKENGINKTLENKTVFFNNDEHKYWEVIEWWKGSFGESIAKGIKISKVELDYKNSKLVFFISYEYDEEEDTAVVEVGNNTINEK